MKKRLLSFLLFAVLLCPLTAPAVLAQESPAGNWRDYAASEFSGGDGTEESPYLIGSAEELAYLALLGQEFDCILGFYRLTADIDLSEHYWTPMRLVGDTYEGLAYSLAHFDGGGHSITGLNVNKYAWGFYRDSKIVDGMRISEIKGVYSAGLFSIVRGAVVKDLTIIDPVVKPEDFRNETVQNVHENYRVSAALTGYSFRSVIMNCHVINPGIEIQTADNDEGAEGYIYSRVAGMAAWCDGEVILSDSSVSGGEIKVRMYTGGDTVNMGAMAGVADGPAMLLNCWSDTSLGVRAEYSTGFYASDLDLGGLAGNLGSSSVINCFYGGDIQVHFESPPEAIYSARIGGLGGYTQNLSMNNYFSGTIDVSPEGDSEKMEIGECYAGFYSGDDSCNNFYAGRSGFPPCSDYGPDDAGPGEAGSMTLISSLDGGDKTEALTRELNALLPECEEETWHVIRVFQKGLGRNFKWLTGKLAPRQWEIGPDTSGGYPVHGAGLESALPFSDVNRSDWFYHEVLHTCMNGILNGTGDTTFSPDSELSRAAFTAALWNMEGNPKAQNSSAFDDVPEGKWYGDAIAWASEAGIVTGISSSGFGPDNHLTREQMAVMLTRYADYRGLDINANSEYLYGYRDASEISEYALQAMHWCFKNDMISGTGGNMLSPGGISTRAQAAVVLARFHALISG